MSQKITAEHLSRSAVVYVRQSTMSQVVEHTESQNRQYALAESARAMGFTSVTTIDDDLGRSGSGSIERPGFQKLVASVCAGSIGAVFCLEASRLARNGRDWHHLIDLCALVGTVVVDHDGIYDPRLVNDRLLLGLKGTMSEYELSLLRQRGIAARDSKARRGKVDVRLCASDTEVTLEVVDNGPGIPVADLDRVLDRFYRAGNTTGQGSGLGLAIAAKVAAKHHAGFSVLNRTDGQGLKVSVSGLHRASADNPAVAARSSSARL